MNRYLNSSDIPQPIRKVIPSSRDIIHKLTLGERIDNLAFKYYNDSTLAWIIMCANPEFDNEFEPKPGDLIRVPFPLQRVYDTWRFSEEL